MTYKKLLAITSLALIINSSFINFLSPSLYAASKTVPITPTGQVVDPVVTITDPDSQQTTTHSVSSFMGSQTLSEGLNANKLFNLSGGDGDSVDQGNWIIESGLCPSATINSVTVGAQSNVLDFNNIKDPLIMMSTFDRTSLQAFSTSSVQDGWLFGADPSSVVRRLDPAQESLPDNQQTSLAGPITATWDTGGVQASKGLGIWAVFVTGEGNATHNLEITSVSLDYDDTSCNDSAVPDGLAPGVPKTSAAQSIIVITLAMLLSLIVSVLVVKRRKTGISRIH